MFQKIFSPHFRATRRINSYVPSPLNSPAAARRLTQKLGNHLTPTSMRKKRSSPPHEAAQQVWSLTQFFSVSFFWKIIDLPGPFPCGFLNIGISQKWRFRAFLWISGRFLGDFRCPRAPEIHIFC